MSKREVKTAVKPPAAPAAYSEELPDTAKERDRAQPRFVAEVKARQKGPDPGRDAPYGGGSFNGTNDSSRFSTPPARKS